MKIKKAVWELFDKDTKALFKPVIPDGKTEADAEEFDNGEEDAKGLKSALDKERKDALALRQANAKTEEEKRALAEEAARKSGDIDALEKSWKEKSAGEVKAERDKAAAIHGHLRKMLVETVADKLASETSTVPSLMREAYLKRLDVNLDGDTPSTRVLDAAGKPSALSLDDLKKEILADKTYAPILKGVDSSGGGAGAGRPGAGGFSLKQFKKQDGSVDWGAVNKANQADPTILKQVQDGILAETRGGATGATDAA